ncbi:MAG: peptide deformylase [Candidatus Krumholzibacteria bacterium]|jgi:peptide deformylase|nr:peptide deformylase [Candidatus Krumholzibacteria bacterium]MDP6797246.1 peptide deformylase [Candidatus Krumholzibacteria bacterium]MDP7021069.1 peptide deformylase [Candidatus Krumholzibacteria bacterium]
MDLSLSYFGDPFLRKATREVSEFGDPLRAWLPRMVEIMRAEAGVGLAANQVGLDLCFCIVIANVDEEDRERDEILLMANPRILEKSRKEVLIEEGCLSIPGIREDVRRPDRIRVRFHDIEGELRELETGNFLSRVIQHEVDHLDGLLFVDRLSSAKQALLKKKLAEIREEHSD